MPIDYVSKLARMLQDIEVSRTLNASFKRSLVAAPISRRLGLTDEPVGGVSPTPTAAIDLVNIKILNAGAWARGTRADHQQQACIVYLLHITFIYGYLEFYGFICMIISPIHTHKNDRPFVENLRSRLLTVVNYS